jgi:hypothetical protein
MRPSTIDAAFRHSASDEMQAHLAPWSAITSKIIPRAMSVPQNRVRLICECRLPPGPDNSDQTERAMRFMVIVKASKDSEAGVMPSTELLTAMGKFNEEMVKAGVMEAGEGLHPTSKGARIKYSGGQSAATRGPFNLSSDLVAGFWLIKTKSLDEAIDWMKRAPFDGGDEIEIRQVFAAEDFGEALTPELREQEERLRAQATKQ